MQILKFKNINTDKNCELYLFISFFIYIVVPSVSSCFLVVIPVSMTTRLLTTRSNVIN